MRAAADSLGVAVSSISRKIAQLEVELGVQLIEHGKRTLQLTQAGELTLAHFENLQEQRGRFDNRLCELRQLRAGSVQLAVGEGFIGMALSHVLSRFLIDHPGIEMDVRVVASSSEAAQLVADDEAHLGLAFLATDDPRVRVRIAIPQPLCVVVRPDHPLAGRQDLRLADLAEHTLCLADPSFRTRQLLRTAEIAEGVSLHPVFASNSLSLLQTIVISDGVATVLPALAVHRAVTEGKLVTLPLHNPLLQSTTVALVSRPGRQLSPAPARLMTVLHSYLQKHAQNPHAPIAPLQPEQTKP
jgi:DNA-binding transcriptional LysR family regulator